MKFGSVVRSALLSIGLAATGCAEDAGEPATPPATEPAVTESASALPSQAHVLMLSPQDGELVVGPEREGRVAVSVKMGLEGARIALAGHMETGTGHHHVIVDAGPLALGVPVPFDAQHLHFGKGQSEAELLLTPGHHRLTLQFADGAHRSYGPELATSIDIWVEPARA